MTTRVSSKLAKLLKEKGFDRVLKYHYPNLNIKKQEICLPKNWNNFTDMVGNSNYYSAPTIAEVVMWLHEKHGIWVHASCDVDGNFYPKISFSREKNWFNLELRSKMNDGNRKIILLDCKSPAKAYEITIKYVLTELI